MYKSKHEHHNPINKQKMLVNFIWPIWLHWKPGKHGHGTYPVSYL